MSVRGMTSLQEKDIQSADGEFLREIRAPFNGMRGKREGLNDVYNRVGLVRVIQGEISSAAGGKPGEESFFYWDEGEESTFQWHEGEEDHRGEIADFMADMSFYNHYYSFSLS